MIDDPNDPNEALRRKHAKERVEAEASWRGISDAQINAKVRMLDGHPMRLILGRMLATAVRRHARRSLGLLPPEFLNATDDPSAALRTAASNVHTDVRRGPVLDDAP